MNVVDIVVACLVVLAAVQGLRLGAVVQVLTFGGLFAGLYFGASAASLTVTWAHTPTTRIAAALATMLGMGVICSSLGRLLGAIVFPRIHRGVIGTVDSALGLVVAVVASLLAAWLLASTLMNSSSMRLNTSIAGSRIIRSLDNVLPAPPQVFAQVQSFLSSEGFPSVFAQLAPISAGPVPLPGNAVLQQAVTRAGASTVKVVGVGCGQVQEGSGFVVGPGEVVTNAHVIAGIGSPMVEDDSGLHQTTTVMFDPSYDLAVLRVGGLREPVLALDPADVGRGTQGAVLGYPGGGPFTAVSAGVMAAFQAQGRDIYGQGLSTRGVYEIQSQVRPGNWGDPWWNRTGR